MPPMALGRVRMSISEAGWLCFTAIIEPSAVPVLLDRNLVSYTLIVGLAVAGAAQPFCNSLVEIIIETGDSMRAKWLESVLADYKPLKDGSRLDAHGDNASTVAMVLRRSAFKGYAHLFGTEALHLLTPSNDFPRAGC